MKILPKKKIMYMPFQNYSICILRNPTYIYVHGRDRETVDILVYAIFVFGLTSACHQGPVQFFAHFELHV